MASEREQEGNVPNRFLNLVSLWQNYLTYWIEVNRNFYENAINTHISVGQLQLSEPDNVSPLCPIEVVVDSYGIILSANQT
jgi:hypothetical protein